MTRDELYVPYEQYTAAHVWLRFAAAAMGGLNAFGYEGLSVPTKDVPGVAAWQADMMLEEFRTRFARREKT